MTDALIELAREVGLQPDYVDAWGDRRIVGEEVLRAILSALGFQGDPVSELAGIRRRAAEQMMPRAILIRGHGSGTITIPVDLADQVVTAELELEQGAKRIWRQPIADLALVEEFVLDGRQYQRRLLPVPDSPLGYHRLRLTLGPRQDAALVIVAPDRAWNAWKGANDRHWGLSIQLYALRSSRNWGIGDFTDLANLLERAAATGAAAVGLNPLHTLFPDEPERASPYSPSTRLYYNPLYLDVEAIADFARSREARDLVGSYEVQRELGRLRGTDQVDYAAVAGLKRRALRTLFETFERSASPMRRRAFARYVASQGRQLQRLGTYERLREIRSAEDLSQRDWRNWPSEYQDPDSPEVAAFAEREVTAIRFTAYIQWQIDEQLGACLRRARALGLPIGLYGDLAVGVDAGGAEAWWNQAVVVRGLTVGAPPDALNTKGQNWGLPLFSPVALQEQAFAPFIAVLRAGMRHAGAIRIDHVLGLIRLWCVPDGNAATDGAYLAYPFKDLIAIVALESHRQRCMIIGEDLGTLPPGIAEILADAGILSYSVLYFEREGSAFRTPSSFKRNALTTIGTHDLPPLARWWRGDDLVLRAKLGLLGADSLDVELERRRGERAALAHWSGSHASGATPPVVSIHRTLATTPSRLMMVQFEDMVPEARQVNLPGTTDEHPNWRNKLDADIEALFADRLVADTLDAVSGERHRARRLQHNAVGTASAIVNPPRAAYRLQFNADFTFADAEELVPYFAALGVSHIYASSIFRARPGSSHGYDITDHDMINPEVGTETSFDSLVAALRSAGIGLILDFVPNHMGIGKADNDWWLDVLEWGMASPYANYFDIDWRSSRRLLRGKVLLPFLGDQYGAVLAVGALELRFDSEFGSFSVWYGEHRFPIRPFDYAELLGMVEHPAVAPIAEAFAALSSQGLRRGTMTRERVAMLKQALANLPQSAPDAAARIAGSVARVSADASARLEQSALHRLLERQHYRLAFWRVASDEINYRRFFDINDLAGIRVERPDVFHAVHRGIVRLIAKGAIQGIRIDHIDGLADPLQYLRRLSALVRRYRPKGSRARQGDDFYIVVEKILGSDESLPPNLPIAGTTGYEFAVLVNGLFIDPDGRPVLDALYREIGGERSFAAVVHTSKLLVMETMLASELVLLSERLDSIAKSDLSTRDYSIRRLRRALTEIVAGMDVYRTYATEENVAAEDRRRILIAVAHARHRWRGTDRTILDFVERVLDGDILSDGDPRAADVGAFRTRFQQYTGPVMAKAAEDTAFYRYNRFISLNEVGGNPERFGSSIAEFHAGNAERALRWPGSMLATATHDTKRGEDSRLRVAALSEMADEWADSVRRWNAIDRQTEPQGERPDGNDAYLIYQTLVGSWPSELVGLSLDRIPIESLAVFRKRVEAYAIKAVRESKAITSWTDPNADYERAIIDFVGRLLDPARKFLADFIPFQARVSRLAAAGSIAQLVLKLTVPGVPDIYRGADGWSLSMADPDNRRPVDYALRRRLLEVDMASDAIDWLAEAWRSGSIKVAVTRRLLALRLAHPSLLARGGYRPLVTEGERADRVVAFARRLGAATLIVAAGRLMHPFLADERPSLAWKDVAIDMAGMDMAGSDPLSGRSLRFAEKMDVAELMGDRPASVWICQPP